MLLDPNLSNWRPVVFTTIKFSPTVTVSYLPLFLFAIFGAQLEEKIGFSKLFDDCI